MVLILKYESIKEIYIVPKNPTALAVGASDGMSTVLDDDCMSTEPKDTLKYLILRPNCKLYSHWDMKDSLIF